jgi:hypothetical protein
MMKYKNILATVALVCATTLCAASNEMFVKVKCKNPGNGKIAIWQTKGPPKTFDSEFDAKTDALKQVCKKGLDSYTIVCKANKLLGILTKDNAINNIMMSDSFFPGNKLIRNLNPKKILNTTCEDATSLIMKN